MESIEAWTDINYTPMLNQLWQPIMMVDWSHLNTCRNLTFIFNFYFKCAFVHIGLSIIFFFPSQQFQHMVFPSIIPNHFYPPLVQFLTSLDFQAKEHRTLVWCFDLSIMSFRVQCIQYRNVVTDEDAIHTFIDVLISTLTLRDGLSGRLSEFISKTSIYILRHVLLRILRGSPMCLVGFSVVIRQNHIQQ